LGTRCGLRKSGLFYPLPVKVEGGKRTAKNAVLEVAQSS
jgi:hypothetical protein